ncbi:MAG: hypothetical protein HONBIEJF_02381 [Fimbriimonadaceae bacterium]|nr:hypothetical protein [Fimbriimonadaceae bacterium]
MLLIQLATLVATIGSRQEAHPFSVIQSFDLKGVSAASNAALIASDSLRGHLTVDDRGTSAFCWSGAVWDLRHGAVRRDLAPLVVRNVETRNWLPVLSSNADRASKILGNGSSPFGRILQVMAFDGRSVTVLLDGSELPPGETERERALVPGLRVVASYDLGKEGGARAVTAWTQEPSPRWISPNADHVIGTVKGALAVCVIPSKPPRGVKEHGNLKRVAGVAAKRFRGLLSLRSRGFTPFQPTASGPWLRRDRKAIWCSVRSMSGRATLRH